MKKIIAAALALLLVLGALPALAAEGDALLGWDEEGNTAYFSDAFAIGGTLYLPDGSSRLGIWRVGDPEVKYCDYDRDSLGESDIRSLLPFECDGELYAIALRSESSVEAEVFLGAALYAMSVDEASGKVAFSELHDVEWDELVERYDGSEYPITPDGVVGMNGKVYMRCYGPNEYEIYVLDLESGRCEVLEGVQDVYAITPYTEGCLLIECVSYGENIGITLLSYDTRDESLTTLTQFEKEDWSVLMGLAYDAATDTAYCISGGELHELDLHTGELGEAVTDVPGDIFGNSTNGVVLEGSYYVFCSQGAVVRNLNAGERPQTRLRVCDDTYANVLSQAQYAFSNAHGDISVVLSRDFVNRGQVVENMMNRDDSVDIYVLNTSSADYDAIYNRGYMMELDGSEKLKALVESFYPELKEAFCRDGRMVALPVECYSWGFGVDPRAMEAIGLSMEDIPNNWSDFLDFLPTLADRMTEESHVSLLYRDETVEDVRNEFFNAIFTDYQNYVNLHPEMGYNSPLLRGLLQKLEGIDFEAFGYEHSERDDDEQSYGVRVYDYDDEYRQLFTTTVGRCFGSFYSSEKPLLLGLDADTPATLVLSVSVAFVNPFSQHPEEAVAFLETVAESLPKTLLYNFDPELSEPLRSSYYEKSLAETQESIDRVNKQLEEADEVDKQALEEELRFYEEQLEYVEANYWDVTEETVEWYRGNDDHLALASVNWLYSDESGEAYQLIWQYIEGEKSLDEMLTGIDRKVQMMMMEGN